MGLNTFFGVSNTPKMGLNTSPKWVSTYVMGLNTVPKNGCVQTQLGSVETHFGVSTPPRTGVETQTNGSQHLVSIQNGSFNMLFFAGNKAKTIDKGGVQNANPQHHVLSVHGSLVSVMRAVALSSTRQHDDHVDPQHKNPMNS